MPILISSASGSNGDAYWKLLLAFSANGAYEGIFSNDSRIVTTPEGCA